MRSQEPSDAALRPVTHDNAWSRAFVYVMDGEYGVKVGVTDDVARRRGNLERASGSPVSVLASFEITDPSPNYKMARLRARAVERLAHAMLRRDRTTGEWFHTHPLTAVDVVRLCVRVDTRHAASLHLGFRWCGDTMETLVRAGAYRHFNSLDDLYAKRRAA